MWWTQHVSHHSLTSPLSHLSHTVLYGKSSNHKHKHKHNRASAYTRNLASYRVCLTHLHLWQKLNLVFSFLAKDFLLPGDRLLAVDFLLVDALLVPGDFLLAFLLADLFFCTGVVLLADPLLSAVTRGDDFLLGELASCANREGFCLAFQS